MSQLREQLPDAVMRTTLIVGFPGETEEQFDHLAGFLESQRFDHVGVFTYSAEEGTAAAKLPNPVPAEIATARKDRLMTLQHLIQKLRHRCFRRRCSRTEHAPRHRSRRWRRRL